MIQKKQKEKVIIVCPGRGSYTKDTLNYLGQFSSEINSYIEKADQRRIKDSRPSITELDQKTSFIPKWHMAGEHASGLIYTCSYADFMSIDQNNWDIVAITGNSMGWYTTLSCAQGMLEDNASKLVETMGRMMEHKIIGGQLVYSLVNEKWEKSKELEELLYHEINLINQRPDQELYLSIDLGGMAVIGGKDTSLKELMKKLPKKEQFPFKLPLHAAFHTPLMQEISEKALKLLSEKFFQNAKYPMIDGRGKIWYPHAYSIQSLYKYTLIDQVICPYSFTKAIEVGLKEFAPDKLILLGPGNSLGPAVGQILIDLNWKKIKSKKEFKEMQESHPFVLSMGLSDQRKIVLGPNDYIDRPHHEQYPIH